ncbi:MAG: polyprenyl synthetase family protein [candidate division NC10 bacterium]|nr:polyprenyl synthetase family protein [candidate division NC10 bacterium]
MTELAQQNGLFGLVAEELRAVETCLQAPVGGNGLLSSVARYAIASGGKRVRPALVLLAARACGAKEATRMVMLASVAEMMHAATLIHDDIVDRSPTRRGRPSTMARWGAEVSVLVGDFLYSRAVQMLVADEDLRIMRGFADATVAMTEAEVLQLQHLWNLTMPEPDYLKIVRGKTAALMSASCRGGAQVAGAPEAVIEALAAYGLQLGIGFQLVDDALDYAAREERLGKPVASDFREGKITYPILHVMAVASEADRAALVRLAGQQSIEEGDVAFLRALVERYAAIPATMRLVDGYLARARASLGALPDSPARESLLRLVDFVRERDW